MKSLVAAIGAAATFAGCFVSAPAPTALANDHIDKLFAQWNRPDSQGCSVGVSRNGRLEYERAYGMANLELNAPITPDSSMEAASISKQFTAMSVMLLAERGRLSLGDDVRKYLPEMPDLRKPTDNPASVESLERIARRVSDSRAVGA